MVVLEPKGEEEQANSCGYDGSPDNEAGEVVDEEGVKDCNDNAGEEGVDEQVGGIINIFQVLLDVIKAE